MNEAEKRLGIHNLPKPSPSFNLTAEVARRVKQTGYNQYQINPGEVPLPRGYSKNASYSVILESIEGEQFWHALTKVTREAMNIKEARLETFLLWVNNKFTPQLVYYPHSGSHLTPREVFGADKVIHLSIDNCHPHLKELKTGQRIKGDASQPPFKKTVFDAAFIRTWGLDLNPNEIPKAVDDICLALKDRGLIVVELRKAKGNWQFKKERKMEKRLLKHLKNNFEQINVGKEVLELTDREEDLIFLDKLNLDPNEFYVFRNIRKPKKFMKYHLLSRRR